MRKKLVLSCMLLVMLIGTISMRAEAKASDTPKRDFANIVLFAHFSGENAQEDAAYFAKKENRDKIISYYNGTHGRSMTNYLKTVSYGKFQIHNIFPQDDGTKITSYGLSMSEKEAQSKNIDSTIIEEIIRNVPGIQGQTIDYDGDGIIDNLTVVMKGTPPSGSASVISTLVSHKSDFPDPSVKWSGKGIGTYNMLSTDRILDQQSGVIIHEFLHSLGYPDLYRGNLEDPKEPCRQPVFIWDVMASAVYRVSYPLAYTRMKYTGWLDIETVSESTSLTLDTQDKAEGNQAYILKSPVNEHELFVVEYRKAGERFTSSNQYNTDSLDAALPGDENSGVIVYRVNTTVTGLSNYYGQTGIYVFRPQKGQNGYAANSDGSCNENMTVLNAALSDHNGRTSIGHEDLNKKLTDGALTFSDGTNSGIVISNIKRNSDGSQMTLDVSIPDASDFDLWKDTGFTDTNSNSNALKSTEIVTCYGTQHLITNTDGNLQTYKYIDDKWSSIGNSINIGKNISDKKLFSYNNELYFAYLTSDQKIYLKKCDKNGTWTDILSITDACSDFDIKEVGGTLYLTYASGSMKAILGRIDNKSFIKIGEYFNYMCGQPKICELGEDVYVSVRDAENGNKIKVFKYDGSSGFIRVNDDSCIADSYDIVSLDGKIYIALGSSQQNGSGLKIASYDGNKWEIGKDSGIASFEPNLAVTQGNMYILVSSTTGEGNTKVYQYDTEKEDYIQEGIDVDTAGDSLSLTSSENKLFISYVRKIDNKIVAKTKKTANELLSLTIVPPKKTTYFVGDKTDSSGINVIANYSKGSREVADGAYQITNFNTDTAGSKIAKVTYGGKEGIFPYEVVNRHEHQFAEWETLDSSCEGGSYRQRICNTCGYKESEGLNDARHTWEQSLTVEKEATCTEDGSKSIHCQNCGAVKSSVIIFASGHSFKEYVSDNNGTCVADGTKTAKCEKCEEKVTVPEPGSKTGHKYTTTVNKATISRDGSIVTECNVCKTKKSSTAIYYPKSVTLSGTSFTYNGKQQSPSVVVKDSKGGAISSSSYMVYYPGGRKEIGQYTVNIVFKGNYSGSVQKTFQIVPKGTKISKLSKGKKKMTVKWKKQKTQISGYEIQYSLKSDFSSSTKTKSVGKKKTSVKLSKLKSKKKYYVRIRTYKTVKINGKNVKIYSLWSGKKSVKVL